MRWWSVVKSCYGKVKSCVVKVGSSLVKFCKGKAMNCIVKKVGHIVLVVQCDARYR